MATEDRACRAETHVMLLSRDVVKKDIESIDMGDVVIVGSDRYLHCLCVV